MMNKLSNRKTDTEVFKLGSVRLHRDRENTVLSQRSLWSVK
jgi:hypothetical protein